MGGGGIVIYSFCFILLGLDIDVREIFGCNQFM